MRERVQKPTCFFNSEKYKFRYNLNRVCGSSHFCSKLNGFLIQQNLQFMNRRLVLYCFKSLKPILEPHRDENTLEETLNRKFDETQTTRMEISNVLQDIYKYIYLPEVVCQNMGGVHLQ